MSKITPSFFIKSFPDGESPLTEVKSLQYAYTEGDYQKFVQTYKASPDCVIFWLGRKIMALPYCALSVIRIAFNVFEIAFSLIRNPSNRSVKEFRLAKRFEIWRHGCEIAGYIVMLFNDRWGLFIVQKGKYHRELYARYLYAPRNEPKKPETIVVNTVIAGPISFKPKEEPLLGFKPPLTLPPVIETPPLQVNPVIIPLSEPNPVVELPPLTEQKQEEAAPPPEAEELPPSHPDSTISDESADSSNNSVVNPQSQAEEPPPSSADPNPAEANPTTPPPANPQLAELRTALSDELGNRRRHSMGILSGEASLDNSFTNGFRSGQESLNNSFTNGSNNRNTEPAPASSQAPPPVSSPSLGQVTQLVLARVERHLSGTPEGFIPSPVRPLSLGSDTPGRSDDDWNEVNPHDNIGSSQGGLSSASTSRSSSPNGVASSSTSGQPDPSTPSSTDNQGSRGTPRQSQSGQITPVDLPPADGTRKSVADLRKMFGT